jgi:hypothetical protein
MRTTQGLALNFGDPLSSHFLTFSLSHFLTFSLSHFLTFSLGFATSFQRPIVRRVRPVSAPAEPAQ